MGIAAKAALVVGAGVPRGADPVAGAGKPTSLGIAGRRVAIREGASLAAGAALGAATGVRLGTLRGAGPVAGTRESARGRAAGRRATGRRATGPAVGAARGAEKDLPPRTRKGTNRRRVGSKGMRTR